MEEWTRAWLPAYMVPTRLMVLSRLPLTANGKMEGERLPLFCAPPGGGSTFFYRTFAGELQANRPVYTFEPRGMSGFLPPHQTVEEMAAYYIDAMRTVQAQGPYHLCGLSFGGTVAFEMARQLEAGGETVALLILFDSWAPGVSMDIDRPGSTWRLMLERLRYWIGLHRENLSACDSFRERKRYLQERGERLSQRARLWLTGKRWEREAENPAFANLPEIYRAVAEAEKNARANYYPGRYRGKIHLLQARLRQQEGTDTLATGWKAFAKEEIDVTIVPGSHYSLLEHPCVRVTAERVRQLLEQADGLA